MEIKRILFPTDFSEGTSKAIPYVTDMAKHYGARLYVVHVIQDIAKIHWYAPKVSTEELHKVMEAEAMKKLEGCCAEEFKGYKDIEYRLLKGIPHEEIVKFQADNNIDLIILGTHGSVADKVLRNARCPILVVLPRVEESMFMKLESEGTEVRL